MAPMNKAEFAKLVGRSPRQVSNWIHAGMPAEGTGRKGSELRIDPPAAVQWLLDKAGGRGSGSSDADLKHARTELLKSQKKASDLIHKEKTGQLMPIDEVEALFTEASSIFAGQLNALGSRLAGKLASMTDSKQILKLLKKETDSIRAATAEKFSTRD